MAQQAVQPILILKEGSQRMKGMEAHAAKVLAAKKEKPPSPRKGLEEFESEY